MLLLLPLCAQSIKVKVDPRVELCSVVCHLAGYPEYNRVFHQAYAKEIASYFKIFRNHKTVQLARQLRKDSSISYNAPMDIAVHMNSDFTALKKTLPTPQMDQRWNDKTANDFINALREFAQHTDFVKFLQKHKNLYNTVSARLQQTLNNYCDHDWVLDFFNTKATPFHVVVNILGGPMNYATRYQDDTLHVYSIVGVWTIDQSGQATFPQSVVPTIIHEFCHTYVNPIVDQHQNQLQKPAQKLFRYTEQAMRRQAYSKWQYMIYESIVRACVVLYVNSHDGNAQQLIQQEKNNGFLWIEDLVGLLQKYDRKKHQNFATFFPQVIAFFHTWSTKIEMLQQKIPKVVSISPVNGAKDVDASLTKIVIVFDRPMRNLSWSVMKTAQPFPTLTDSVYYDRSRTIFTMPVKLQSGVTYGFALNSNNQRGFISSENVPLEPIFFTFSTK